LVADSDRVAVAAQHATRTIPIVFTVVGDPIGAKLVDSFARPGGNATGVTDYGEDLSGKRLPVFKDASAIFSAMAAPVWSPTRSRTRVRTARGESTNDLPAMRRG
jgi:putative ABC transport system substrate-binding protein